MKKKNWEIEQLIDEFSEEIEDYLINFEDHLLLFLSLEMKEQKKILKLMEEGRFDDVHTLIVSIMIQQKIHELDEFTEEEKIKNPSILN